MRMKKILPIVIMASIFSFAFGVASCADDGEFSSSSSSSSSSIQEQSDFSFMDYGEYYSVKDYTGTATEILLPSTYNGKPVRAVEDGGFYAKTTLTKISFPESITKIGSAAFAYCENLTKVELPASITSIGQSVFYGCEKLIYAEYGGACYLGGAGNDFLALIKPKSVSVRSVSLHNQTKLIADAAFYCCNRLSVLSLGGVERIGALAFVDCYALTNVELPFSLKEIGAGAFEGCSKLIEIKNASALALTMGETSHGSVAKYAENVYTPTSGQSLLTKTDGFVLKGSLLLGYQGEETELTVPASVTELSDYAFANLFELESLNVSGVEKIGKNALTGCSGLASLTLPFVGAENGVALNSHLGYLFGAESAAKNAECVPQSLQSLQITGGEKIFPSAFENCSSLNEIVLYSGVTEIGENAFAGCNALAFNESGNGRYLPALQNDYFALVSLKDSTVKELTVHTETKLIAGGACMQMKSLFALDLGGVERIGRSAFRGCYSLVQVALPSTLLSIGNSAFEDCYKLIEVKNDSAIPVGKGLASNGYVGYYAENVYSSVSGESVLQETDGCLLYGTVLVSYVGTEEDFVCPSSVTALHSYALAGRADLRSLSIGENVVEFGESALLGCNGLTSLTVPFVGQTREGIENTYLGYLFGGYYSAMNEEVVPQTLTELKITSAKTLHTLALERCVALERVYLPASLENVGDGAFRNCPSLEMIDVAEENTRFSSLNGDLYDKNKTTILRYAPGKINEAFVLPESVLSVKGSAFEGAFYLQRVELPSVQSIGSYAFRYCQSLTSIVLPESVSLVGASAFEGCSFLKIFLCAASVPTAWDKDWNSQSCPVYLSGEWTIVSGVPVPNVTA